VIDTFRDLGYSTLYAFGVMEQYDIYRAIPDLVRQIIVDADHIKACQEYGRPEHSQILSQSDIQKGALIQQVEAKAKGDDKTRYYSLAEWHKSANHLSPDHWTTTIFYGHPLFRDQPSMEAVSPDSDSRDFQPQKDWRCAQTPDHPHGIPLWKMFAFHFWDSSNDHPLGALWTLAPEPYSTFSKHVERKEHNFYAGYSIERYCNRAIPAAERRHRAYILAKQVAYFDPGAYHFSTHAFKDIKEEIGLDFVAGTGMPGSALPDSGITNFGVMNATMFRDVLGHSKALVGIGRPGLSPTPYDSLCMGVPFLNSITNWDRKNPDDKSKWGSQHDALFLTGEPYVYQVKQGDQDALKGALERAVANPIERYIPLRMTARALEARYRSLVETDWEAYYLEKFPDFQI
jgi:hypothetical protein